MIASKTYLSPHFCHLESSPSEGKTRFIQKFCLKEVHRVMVEEEIGAKQAVRELAERWEREGRRPVIDKSGNEACSEKLGHLKPILKEALNNVSKGVWKKVKFCLDSGAGETVMAESDLPEVPTHQYADTRKRAQNLFLIKCKLTIGSVMVPQLVVYVS